MRNALITLVHRVTANGVMTPSECRFNMDPAHEISLNLGEVMGYVMAVYRLARVHVQRLYVMLGTHGGRTASEPSKSCPVFTNTE